MTKDTLPTCLPWIPTSEVISDGGSEANGQQIDPRDQYGPKKTLEQFVRPQLPRIHHPPLPRMLKSEVNMLAVRWFGKGKRICNISFFSLFFFSLSTYPEPKISIGELMSI